MIGLEYKMNCFRMVKDVLIESLKYWNETRGLSSKLIKNKMVNYLDHMTTEWKSGDRPAINYEKPLCRLAYVYRHVAANANLFETVLGTSAKLRNLVEDKLAEGDFRVAAFGGGPGTELLGLAKYISKVVKDGQACHVQFTATDRIQEWSDNWARMANHIRNDEDFKRGRNGVVFDTTFLSLDLVNPQPFNRYEYLLRQDLYIFNYVLSETIDDIDSIQEAINILAASADTGARFVVVDRSQKEVRSLARKALVGAGLSVGKDALVQRNMDSDEQCSVLSSCNKWLGTSPRIVWDSFWVVGTKQ